MTNSKNQLPYEKVVKSLHDATKDTKIVEQENSTGVSFFEGKKRLCKVLKAKNKISIEINVTLDTKTEKLFGLERISRKVAHQKHLGTMQYMARLNDEKQIPKLITAIITAFKAEKLAEDAAKKASNE